MDSPMVLVAKWGDLRGDKKRIQHAVHVLVGYQSAGGIEWTAERGFVAFHYKAGNWKAQETEHTTADEALNRILRSSGARRIGYTAKSAVTWTPNAKKAMTPPKGR